GGPPRPARSGRADADLRAGRRPAAGRAVRLVRAHRAAAGAVARPVGDRALRGSGRGRVRPGPGARRPRGRDPARVRGAAERPSRSPEPGPGGRARVLAPAPHGGRPRAPPGADGMDPAIGRGLMADRDRTQATPEHQPELLVEAGAPEPPGTEP